MIAIVVWLWQSDNPPHADSAEIADGVSLPVGGHGGPSHAFWAMIILLLVDVSVFASLVFAHVHVSMAAEICPPPGAALPDWRWPLASAALLVAGSAAMTVAQLAMGKHRRWMVTLWVGIGMLCLAAAFGLELRGHALAPCGR